MERILLDITNTLPTPAQNAYSAGKPKLLRQTSLLAFAAGKGKGKQRAEDVECPSPPALTSDDGTADEDCSSDLDDLEDGEAQSQYASAGLSKRQRICESHTLSSSLVEEAREARRAQSRLRNCSPPPERLSSLTRSSQYAASALDWNRTKLQLSGLQLSGSPHLPYPKHLVSHDERDVFRPLSVEDHRDFTRPYACAFSNESKKGGRKILAIATEEGSLTLLDAEPSNRTNLVYGVVRQFVPHANATFDVKWSHDDRAIATASGDQTVMLVDVETESAIAKFAGHTGSVKQIAFDPHNPNMLASASRDGSIGIWDRRTRASRYGPTAPVNHIRFAHETYAKTRKGHEGHRSSTRSVTSVVHMAHQEHLLASSGSADGIIKLWDLRKASSRRINPTPVEQSVHLPGLPGESTGRAHGIASLCLSPDGSKLYALSTNSHITVHDPLFISRPLSRPMMSICAPKFVSTSFYSRLSLSPCGRYLASGYSGRHSNTHIWDVGTAQAQRPYGSLYSADAVLREPDAEASCLDWAQDILATVGNGGTVRLWRANEDVARKALDPRRSEETSEYSGAWQK